MNTERKPPSNRSDYRWARQSVAVVIILGVVFLVVVDALRSDFETQPLVLVPLLIFAAAVLGVDIRFLNGMSNGGGGRPTDSDPET